MEGGRTPETRVAGSEHPRKKGALYGLLLRSAGRVYAIRAMSNRLPRPEGPGLASADVIARLEAAEAKIEWLTGLAFASIARQADLEAQGLLTLKQAAYAAGVRSEGTIRNWRDQGKIEVVEVGRKRYVVASSLPTPKA